jgi:hypothetical protein
VYWFAGGPGAGVQPELGQRMWHGLTVNSRRLALQTKGLTTLYKRH